MSQIKVYSLYRKVYHQHPDTKKLPTKYTSKGNWVGHGTETISATTPKYVFGPYAWTFGLPLKLQSDGLNFVLNTDGTAKLLSITPTENYNKRKIIHKLEIKINKHALDFHHDYIQFLILRVKKTIFEKDTAGETNNLSSSSFIAFDDLQLVKRNSWFLHLLF